MEMKKIAKFCSTWNNIVICVGTEKHFRTLNK